MPYVYIDSTRSIRWEGEDPPYKPKRGERVSEELKPYPDEPIATDTTIPDEESPERVTVLEKRIEAVEFRLAALEGDGRG